MAIVAMDACTITSNSPEDTASIAAAVAEHVQPGDVILLGGELAAGKTLFVKALALALGSGDAVTSPTFALAHFYNTKLGQLLHVDAYRLSSPKEYRDLGLEDFQDTCVTVIEWGGLVESEYQDFLSIEFAFAGSNDQRKVTLACCGERWKTAVETIHRQLSV